MSDEELVIRIIKNIRARYNGELSEPLQEIFENKLDLCSTRVFFWSDTSEGDLFWNDIYRNRCRNHLELRTLLQNYYSLSVKKDIFINLEFFV